MPYSVSPVLSSPLSPQVRTEEELGRGEALGALWAITGGFHDTTALCVRDSELVRMSRQVGGGRGFHDTTALCVRDSELVRMSRQVKGSVGGGQTGW